MPILSLAPACSRPGLERTVSTLSEPSMRRWQARPARGSKTASGLGGDDPLSRDLTPGSGEGEVLVVTTTARTGCWAKHVALSLALKGARRRQESLACSAAQPTYRGRR